MGNKLNKNSFVELSKDELTTISGGHPVLAAVGLAVAIYALCYTIGKD